MAGYNFKKFFDSNKRIANQEWVTNTYIMIKRSLLKKNQNDFVNTFSNDNRAEQLENIIKQTEKEIGTTDSYEFIPTKISNVIKTEEEEYRILINENNIAIQEKYYNFIQSLKCKVFVFENVAYYKPLPILKDMDVVGIVMQHRIDKMDLSKVIDYNIYLEQQQQKEQEEKLQNEIKKQNQKKCLYISNNKAVVKNKELTCISDLVGDQAYNRLYVESDYKKDGGKVFIDFGFVLMYVSFLSQYDVEPETIKYRLEKAKDFTLDDYKQYITECLNNNQFINVVEIKLMELAGESSEYIQQLKDHRQKYIKMKDEQHRQKEKERTEKEQAYVDEQNYKAEKIIQEAEQAIRNNRKVVNCNITFYKSQYDSYTTGLILYLMKKHNINVPMRTQGWINQALTNIYYDEKYGWTYQYYKSSANSTVFMGYLQQLVEAINSNFNM